MHKGNLLSCTHEPFFRNAIIIIHDFGFIALKHICGAQKPLFSLTLVIIFLVGIGVFGNVLQTLVCKTEPIRTFSSFFCLGFAGDAVHAHL